MILSKLILFFCFYLLLLLDNSLGKRLLVEQDGNPKLLKDAMEFGATFGGLLGLLGSQWKQLLIQLVHANQNVGLGKYQLARFNDSATTEEVGLVIPDSYADKVEELVAVRVQDIGSTQKYIDDLEILKNEIALTMIVEMDEIKKQFKASNVRKKIKEAKENGISDTDIKEILFAEFIDSGEGLSLIDGRASIAEALLSSFLNGMQSIIDETYDKKLGIIQYSDVRGCSPSGKCFGNENNDEDNNDAGEGGGGQGGAPEGGRSGGVSGGSGGAPGGGGTDPPESPPDGEEDKEPHENEEDDEEPHDNEEEPGGAAGGGDGLQDSQLVGFDIDVNLLPQISHEERIIGDTYENLLFPRFSGGTETRVERPRFIGREESALFEHATDALRPRFESVRSIGNRVASLNQQHLDGYRNHPAFRKPPQADMTNAERLDLYRRRADYIRSLLDNEARLLYLNFEDASDQYSEELELALQNLIYYGRKLGGNVSAIEKKSLVLDTKPARLPGFSHPPEEESDLRRYVLSTRNLLYITDRRFDIANHFAEFKKAIENLTNDLKKELEKIEELEKLPPR